MFSASKADLIDGLQTLTISRIRPHPPTPNSIVLGTITRLSPLQATLSISVVDGVPLPAGEEFAGVIRVQDIRATEKDKVKIGDCFRGADVVRGLVVCFPNDIVLSCSWVLRFPWVMLEVTIYPLLGTIVGLSLQQVKQVSQHITVELCCPNS
jgi:hypothetical protein